MPKTMIPLRLIEDAVHLACRAPSYHNSLGCGETLSAVLLEATMAGLATCTLSHVTEVAASSDIVAAATGRALPEVLVRVGMAPPLETVPPPTPRRPLSEVLHFSGA